MIRIGVIGAGHIGKIHIRQLKEIPDFEIIGFYDQNSETARLVADEFGIKIYDNPDKLIEDAEAIDIVCPTAFHYSYAVKSLKKSRHTFIEKPVAETPEEAKNLMALAKEANVIAQAGHVERFNPAFQAVLPHVGTPMFIEAHRLAQFNPRGTDVSVVLDLMIHDLDIILHVVKSPISKISASGVAVVCDTVDIANARLEFANGCVANITTSRISLKTLRKTRLFQKDTYISIDFHEKKLDVIKIKEVHGQKASFLPSIKCGQTEKEIFIETPVVEQSNAIRTELEKFAESIKTGKQAAVTLEQAHYCMEVAYKILEKIESNARFSLK